MVSSKALWRKIQLEIAETGNHCRESVCARLAIQGKASVEEFLAAWDEHYPLAKAVALMEEH